MLIGQSLIDSVGWRMTYLVYAGIIVVACMPAVALCIRDHPADCGLAPYGEAVSAPEDAGEAGRLGAQAESDAADLAARFAPVLRT